ncbi:MAG: rRNA maturation RNase YbeY [Flavisolibacter sp.]
MVSTNTETIYFHFLIERFFFPQRNRLKDFLKRLLKEEGKKEATINYIFCADAYLWELNKTHLNHNTFTDIITFELSSKNEPLIADVYISVERVKENATTFRTSFQRELHRVIFHGALHLCGYKDKTKEQSQQMRSMEELYLTRYFVPRGTNKL